MNDQEDGKFIEYLYYEKHLNPIELALKSKIELEQLRSEYLSSTGNDPVYQKLSELDCKVSNDHLVSVIKKMTATDTDQTNNVGSWVFYCLNRNYSKACKAKEKVSEKYVTILTKYLDSFIKQLVNEQKA